MLAFAADQDRFAAPEPLGSERLTGRRAPVGSPGPFGSPALVSGEADAVWSADPPGSPFCRLSSRRYGSSLEGGRELVRESSDRRAFCARVSARSSHAVASKSSCDSVARSAGVKAFKSSANWFGTQGVKSPSRRCASPKCAKSSIPRRYAAAVPLIVTTGRDRRSVNGYARWPAFPKRALCSSAASWSADLISPSVQIGSRRITTRVNGSFSPFVQR